MALTPMFKGVVNSPETTITNDISNSDTTIYVLDPVRVPDTLPNLMTLGTGTNAETVKVTQINNSALTVERGFQGIAKNWPTGTVISRNFTEYDYEALRHNIGELDSSKVNNSKVLTDVPVNAVFTDTITQVVDNLSSADTGKALSANQGKVLDGIIGKLTNLTTRVKTNVVAALNGLQDDLSTHSADEATLAQLGHVYHATLTTTLDTTWVGSEAPFSKVQTVTGITANDNPIIDIVMSGTFAIDEERANEWAKIYRITTANNSITLYATDKPEVNLPIQLKVVR